MGGPPEACTPAAPSSAAAHRGVVLHSLTNLHHPHPPVPPPHQPVPQRTAAWCLRSRASSPTSSGRPHKRSWATSTSAAGPRGGFGGGGGCMLAVPAMQPAGARAASMSGGRLGRWPLNWRCRGVQIYMYDPIVIPLKWDYVPHPPFPHLQAQGHGGRDVAARHPLDLRLDTGARC